MHLPLSLYSCYSCWYSILHLLFYCCLYRHRRVSKLLNNWGKASKSILVKWVKVSKSFRSSDLQAGLLAILKTVRWHSILWINVKKRTLYFLLWNNITRELWFVFPKSLQTGTNYVTIGLQTQTCKRLVYIKADTLTKTNNVVTIS